MPKRKFKSREKFESEEVQGEDSFVIIRRPTWGDFQSIIGEDGDVNNLNDLEVGSKMIENLVSDWNWVDDEGEPLPKPTPDVIRELPFEEMQFLVGIIDIKKISEKNSPAGSESISKGEETPPESSLT